MSKVIPNHVIDAALNQIKNNVGTIVLCEGEPASYSDATTLKSSGGHKLGDASISSSDINGPSDGDTSGRKITVTAQTGIMIDENGNVDHVALVDDANTRILHITTTASESVQNGDSFDVDPYGQEIEDPS